MKIFAVFLFLAIVGFSSMAVALKDAVCGLLHSQDGEGGRACLAYIPSWSYQADTNECVSFIYGGCGGNDNRFGTKEQCEQRCKE